MSTLKSFLVILVVALLAVVAFLLVRMDIFRSKADPYSLVPSNGVFVLETKEPVAFWNQLVTQPLWERLSDIPSIKALEKQLIHLDSLAGKAGNLDKSLKRHQFLLSLHPTGKGEFDFLFTVFSDDGRLAGFVKNMESHVSDRSMIKQRNYSGVTLYEYSPELANGVLTYAFFEDVFLASFTSFLVEDAIRTAKSKELLDFKGIHPKLFSSKQPDTSLAALRLGTKGLSTLLAGMTNAQGRDLANDIEQLDLAANFVFDFEEGVISLRSDALETETGAKLSSRKEPSTFGSDFFNYVSNRTAVLRVFDLDRVRDAAPIGTRIHHIKSTVLADVEEAILNRGFMEMVDRQVAYLMFEQVNSNQADKLLLIPAKDMAAAIALLEEFGLKITEGKRELVERDYHLSHKIIALDVEEFPLHVFGGNFEGFQKTYVSNVSGYLLFSNSLRVLRNYLDDLHNDYAWGKSIDKKAITDSFKGDLAFYQWLDLPKFYDRLLSGSAPAWNSVFQKYAAQFKAINMMTLGVGGEGEGLRIGFRYQLEPITPSTDIVLTLSNTVAFRDSLSYGPKMLLNFNDKSSEYLVQDKKHVMHLVSQSGDRVFSQPLRSPILSDIFQIDYYKNGKLQFAFACEDGLYVFDRLGNLLPGFPLTLMNGRKFSFFNLVDYERNRDYRFFASDDMGDLYVFDQQGNLLEGWNPRRTTGPLAEAPSHLRVTGVGDVMVSLHQNGNLELLNRRGESRIGPPVRIGDAVSTSYGLTDGGGSSSQLVTINSAGEVVSVNFNGELTYRNQLHRPDRETKFHIVNSQNGDQFLMVLHEFNKVTVLNSNESPLFEYPVLSESLEFQWFSFGRDRDIFVVIDKVQEFIYLFNLKGELLNSRPLEGRDPVTITFTGSRNEYTVALFHHNVLKEYKLPL